MLNYSNVITKENSYSGIQMKEIRPVMKLIIRGKKREFLSAIGKSLNLLLPTEANTSSSSEKLTALWLSPDEWLVYSNEISNPDNNDYETENLLNKNISKVSLGAVTDVTDQFVLINIKGDKIFDLFETGSPFNFNDFRRKKGSTTQTILAKIDIIIHNQNHNEVNLFVRRSFSQHLFSWMNDSASRL
ncbi:sarcosine oxidase subunit gamma [Candidatus Pelagibacter sp.]|nr:sarcosine oxidase subunit gamma [Candidatus Pelagibacter sp.]